MDSMTGINLQLTRELEQNWSRAAVAQPARHAVQTAPRSVASRQRPLIGARLVAAGLRLKARLAPIAVQR